MKAKFKNLTKIVFGSALISLILVAAPVCAFDGATLSEIKINSKDNYSYKIILKTDKDVPVEKYITADNKIVIALKNTKSAESVNTIYNNTPEIDNVIVQNTPNNNIRIFIQGLNISSSKVILDSRNETLDFAVNNNDSAPLAAGTNKISSSSAESSTAKAMVPSQTIKENEPAPVINFTDNSASNAAAQDPVKPQYSENSIQTPNDDFLQENNEMQTVKNSMAGNASLKRIFSKDGFDWLLRIFAVIFIGIGVFKLFNKSENVTIDLSSENMKTREMEFFKSVNDRRDLATKSLGSNYTREKVVKNPSYGANTQYGIKEYQNSQLPPKKSTRPSENINIDLNRSAKLNSALKNTQNTVETRKPVINNSRNVQRNIKTAKSNADNVKFLESMAAIYQKSGRADLAMNIRQNINKTRTAS